MNNKKQTLQLIFCTMNYDGGGSEWDKEVLDAHIFYGKMWLRRTHAFAHAINSVVPWIQQQQIHMYNNGLQLGNTDIGHSGSHKKCG